jgi:hypothetical protein
MQASEGVNDEVTLSLEEIGSLAGCSECGEWDLDVPSDVAKWLDLGGDLKAVLDRESGDEPDVRWREAMGLLFLARSARAAVGEPLVELAETCEKRARKSLSGGGLGLGDRAVVVDVDAMEHPTKWREYLCAVVAGGASVYYGDAVVVAITPDPHDTTEWGPGGVVLTSEDEDLHDTLNVALKLGSESTHRVQEVWPSALRLVRAGTER